ncbi:MAG: Asp23/Gls24 family envelope stress response protein [Clostridiales bacterium]|nr:Asp23/Gls24 family envelope stress response protein [Clostridiales bacterium]
MAEGKSNFKCSGQVNISDDVIAVIAGTTALQTDGVVGMAGNLAGDIIEMLGKRNFSKGVKISIEDKNVYIYLGLVMRFGSKVHETALMVQENVKTAVENMTGLSVAAVDINISNLVFDKNKPVGKFFNGSSDETIM